MARRRRKQPVLADEIQESINGIHPSWIKTHGLHTEAMKKFVIGYVGFEFRKKEPRADGTAHNTASPWVREQIEIWDSLGRPYEFEPKFEYTPTPEDQGIVAAAMTKGAKRRRKKPVVEKIRGRPAKVPASRRRRRRPPEEEE